MAHMAAFHFVTHLIIAGPPNRRSNSVADLSAVKPKNASGLFTGVLVED